MARFRLGAWLEARAAAIQAMATIVTAVIAVAALVGIKVQIDAAARLQQTQSARDIYREFLSLSINKPEFSDPDYCAIKGSANQAAYENYVEYLLYTSEQILVVSKDWEPALNEHLQAHRDYLCSTKTSARYSDEVEDLLGRYRAKVCPGAKPMDCQYR